jgi:hypothetical protein
LALFTLGFVAFLLVPRFLVKSPPKEVAESMRPIFTWFVHPAALFAVFVLTIFGGRLKSPLSFSMAEVELLFPAPFTRRQLLIYKLATSAAGTLGVGLMMPLFVGPPWPLWWPALLVGVWLTITFEQWSAMLVVLALDGLSARVRAGLYVVIGLLALVVTLSLWHAGVFDPRLELRERLSVILESNVSRLVTAPFVVFSRTISAQSTGPLAAWGAAAVAMTLCVVWLILRMDANFLEASLAASQRRYEMLERAKRSGGLPTIGIGAKPRFTLPRLPRLFGAGPVAWRQSLELMRGSGRLLFILPALLGPLVAVLFTSQRNAAPQAAIMILVPLFIGFFVSMIMPLALRADLDHVDAIKTLPVRSTAIVWGSVGAAIVYVTVLQWIATLAMAAVNGRWTQAASLAVVAAIPTNLLFIAFDSVLVILFPSVRRVAPGDLLVGVRIVLVNFVKVLFAFVAAAVASLGVLAAWLVWGESLFAMALCGCFVLLLEGIATVWVAGLLFDHFDPSSDQSDKP